MEEMEKAIFIKSGINFVVVVQFLSVNVFARM